MTPTLDCYTPARRDIWSGRIDDREAREALRWHQVVQPLNLHHDPVPGSTGQGFCFVGYGCDRGVEQNLGRPGAARGPNAIRGQLGNLPVDFTDAVRLLDAGDIRCGDADVARSQMALAAAVARVVELGLLPVVLGGGHDLAYGHWLGLSQSLEPQQRLGVVNFDAHFDLRPQEAGANSGSSFAQIADHCQATGEELRYLCIGVQRSANTVRLFRRADELGVDYVLAKEIRDHRLSETEARIDTFLDRLDAVYVTVCADVMSSAFVPGVSAPQPLGLDPETVLQLLKHILANGKTVSFDVAEVSPRFDSDNNTAKVAAIFIYALVDALLTDEERIA